MNKRINTLISLLLCTACFTSTANAEGIEDYYVVELTIFTNETPENIQEEEWRKEIVLEYPTNLAYFTEEGIYTVYPELITLAKEATEKQDNSTEESTNTVTETPKIVEVTPAPLGEKNNELQLPAFLPLLDKTYYEHKESVSKIKWSKKYNIILNQTWLQKLEGKEASPNIVIQAGEVKSDIYQLAGTINLFKERYLHIKTNLWLVHFTQDNENADEEESEKENSIINTSSLSAQTETGTNIKAIVNTLELEIKPAPSQWPMPPTTEILDYKEAQKSKNNNIPKDNTSPLLLEITTPDTNIIEIPPLPIERIVTMQQKRKMRSREVHYIDHPLFGLMIEIRPYKLPVDKTTSDSE